MELKKKICMATRMGAIFGVLFPMVLLMVFREFFILPGVLLLSFMVVIICVYFDNKNIVDIKYNKCGWEEYKEFIEDGYLWLGRKVYFYKDLRRDIELLECAIVMEDTQSIPILLEKIHKDNHKKKKQEEIQIGYLFCVALWQQNKKEEYIKEKQKIYAFMCSKKQLELDIYEAFFNESYVQACKELMDYPITCKFDEIWKNHMVQLVPDTFKSETNVFDHARTSSIPKVKVKFPMMKVSILFILILLIILSSLLLRGRISYQSSVKKAFEATYLSNYDKNNVVFEKEDDSFRIEVQIIGKGVWFLVYEIDEDSGKYKLIQKWGIGKSDLWKAENGEEEIVISDVWLSTQLCKNKLKAIENIVDINCLVGVSRNKEINNIKILDIPFSEIIPIKIADEEWFVYYWEGEELKDFEKSDIRFYHN